jgi:hypothetical protein
VGELESALDALDALAAEDLDGLVAPQLLDRTAFLTRAANRIMAELTRTVRRCEVTHAGPPRFSARPRALRPVSSTRAQRCWPRPDDQDQPDRCYPRWRRPDARRRQRPPHPRTALQVTVPQERFMVEEASFGLVGWWRGNVAVARPKAFDIVLGVRP